jgi:DHA1 family tetracycline resistance protein-like MFS transporter
MAKRAPSLAFILIALLIDGMSIGMIAPVLPSRVGEFVADREAQSYWVGAIAVAWGAMHFIAAPMLGAASDRFGRRPLLMLSIAGLVADLLLMAFATSPWMMLAGRVLGGLTASGFIIGAAYVADITPPDQRSRGLGRLGAAVGVGLILGPAAGGLMGEWDPRLPFLVAAGLSTLNFAWCAFVLPESLPAGGRLAFSIARANPFAALASITTMRGVGTLMIVFGLIKLAQFLMQAVWVLYTRFRFDWGPRDSGIALFCVGLAAAVAQGLLLGMLLRRFGEQRTLLIGLVSAAVAMLGFGLATEGWMIYAIIAVSLPGLAAAPALQGLVSKSFDAARQGVAMGALNAVGSVAAIVAPLAGAPLLAAVSDLPTDDWRLGAPFFLAAASVLLAFGLSARRFSARVQASQGPVGGAHMAAAAAAAQGVPAAAAGTAAADVVASGAVPAAGPAQEARR